MVIRQAPFSDRLNLGYYLNTVGLVGVGAEVGVHRGAFAERLLATWIGRQLYCVDHWRPYDSDDPSSQGDRKADYRAAKAALADPRAVLLRMESADAALVIDAPLCFAYVDACHRREAVARDLRTWWPKVAGTGLLAGHDFTGEWAHEVQPAVLEFAAEAGVDVFLVVEPSGAPWSYYMVKP